MCDEQLINLIKNSIRPLKPIKTGIAPRFFRQGSVKAVLFDIYGTLIISASGGLESSKKSRIENLRAPLAGLLKNYGIDKKPDELDKLFNIRVKELHQKMHNSGIDFPEVKYEEIWKHVLGIKDNKTIKLFTLEYEMIVNPVYVMPNAKEVLSFLNKNGVVLGIISNAQFFTPLILKAVLGKGLKETGISNDLILFSFLLNHAKPSMVFFKQAVLSLSMLGIKPDQTLYVGNDMCSDIYPANKSGFKTALFAGDKRSLRLCSTKANNIEITPDYIITDLDQIKKCI